MNMPDGKYTILIVDDEPMIRDATSAWFQNHGHRTLSAETGMQALEIVHSQRVDVILLDLMLPDISGEEVCARIRLTSMIPVIMLTAKSSEDDIICGLQTGADDYVVKPFSLRELEARVEAVCHRANLQNHHAHRPVDSESADSLFVMNKASHELFKKGEPIALTPAEWKLMDYFMSHRGKICTREILIEAAFEDNFEGFDRAIDTHIKNLRKKIENDPKKPIYIKTVHGFGYKFELPES